MKTIGIIGSRRRNSPEDFLLVQEAFCQLYEEGDEICSGLCPKGGDKFAVILAQIWDTPVKWFRALWKDPKNGSYRRWAGFERNTDIAFRSDILIACVASDRKGGTEDCIKKFIKFNEKKTLFLV
jgi:hypothetical protein